MITVTVSLPQWFPLVCTKAQNEEKLKKKKKKKKKRKKKCIIFKKLILQCLSKAPVNKQWLKHNRKRYMQEKREPDLSPGGTMSVTQAAGARHGTSHLF